MSHSAQDDEGTGDEAMEAIQLTSEELQFRAELLEAAARLDVPSPLGEQRLFARFNEQESLRGTPWLPRLLDSRRPAMLAVTSIAAAASEDPAKSAAPGDPAKLASPESPAKPTAPNSHAKLISPESHSKPAAPDDHAQTAATENQWEQVAPPVAVPEAQPKTSGH